MCVSQHPLELRKAEGKKGCRGTLWAKLESPRGSHPTWGGFSLSLVSPPPFQGRGARSVQGAFEHLLVQEKFGVRPRRKQGLQQRVGGLGGGGSPRPSVGTGEEGEVFLLGQGWGSPAPSK